MPLLAPDSAGPDLPPAGSSLFDLRVAELGGPAALPYPFERLLQRLEGPARCADLPDAHCLVRVLIPIGRSLQRTAASPDFFRHPRVVAAMAGEPQAAAGAPLQRDRLYLGHVGNGDLIEVISYNEAAARFEFQLVTDYRPGATPRVVYAPRGLCVACHQNHAPIFSRPLWQETNANPAVAARLAAFRTSVEGVPVHRGIDLPGAIDAAAGRATRFALWQTLWQTGCGEGPAGALCRGALLEAALHYRASGRTAPPTLHDAIGPRFAAAWHARWPGGLSLPDPNIPNRDPLPDEADGREGLLLANIAAPFDPLLPRAPLDVWHAPDAGRLNETVAGLAEFVGETDVAALAAALGGALDEGERSQRLARAIAAMAADSHGPLADGPFRRDALMAALLARLGRAPPRASTLAALLPGLAPATTELPAARPSAAAGPFQRYCTPCHQTPTRSPPNFLHGPDAVVRAQLAQCAERIRFRLAMWELAPQDRPKTPMPPQQSLAALGADAARWPGSAELASLRDYATRLAGGTPMPRPDNYEALPPCLPAPG